MSRSSRRSSNKSRRPPNPTCLFRDARLQSRLQRLPRPYRLWEDRQRQSHRRRQNRSASTRTAPSKSATVTKLLSHAGLAKIETQRSQRGQHRRPRRLRRHLHRRNADRLRGARAAALCRHRPADDQDAVCVNDCPLAGREGKFLTARQIRDRLVRETRTNVCSFSTTPTPPASSRSRPAAKCRSRFSSSRCAAKDSSSWSRAPRSFSTGRQGQHPRADRDALRRHARRQPRRHPADLANRKGEITHMDHHPHSVSVEAVIPTRGLIGFETDLVNLTKRRRHHVPSLQGIRRRQGRNPHAQQRRARLDGNRRQRPALRSKPFRNAAASSSARRKKFTRAWSSAKTPAPTTWRSIRARRKR